MPRYRRSIRAWIAIVCTLAIAASTPALARRLPFLTGTPAGLLTGADALATADFDGDGDLDFAAANSVIDKLVWMEATPGGFVEHTITTALDAPVDVAAADIDCDGDSDLVVAVANTGSVVWERNDSGATSWALGGTISSTIGGVVAVATGKITANDTVDVVAATLSGADEIVAWARTSCSSAVWNSAVVSSALSGATDVATADTNADGITDVVATFTGRVAVFEHGAGNSFTRVDVDTGFAGAAAVVVGDVDRDGDLDVAATGNAAGQVAWWANPGTAGAWTKSTVGSLANAMDLALGDVDADGDLDVVASSSSSSVPLQWWDNASGDGAVWTAQQLDPAPGAGRRVATVDADGDGDADVVAAALAAGVRVYENDSTHRSAELGSLEHLFYPYGSGGQIVDLTHADVDGDGLLDVVVVWQGSSPAEHSVQWYAGIGGSPTSGVLQFDSLAHTIQTPIVTAIESVAMGDVDRDGDVDAFVGHKWFAAQTYAFCRNDGGGTAWSCFSVGDSHWLVDAVELADVDADRDLDVVAVVQESSGGAWLVLWWENAGDPTLDADWIRHDIASDGPFDELRVVDLDNDVDLDVVAGATWWRNDGGSPPVWVAQSIPNVWDPSFGMSSWALADVDVDGDLDIAAESGTSGLLWSRNDLPVGWTGSEFLTPSPAGGPLGDFTFGDLDGDGDPDLVAGMMQTTPPQPRVSWWENDTRTNAFAWTEHALEPRGMSASHLQVADFDRDGDPDVVMAAGGEFVSWFNGGGQVALEARNMSGPALRDGLEQAVLVIDAYHRGRAGEAAAELASVSLLFEASAGTSLTQPQLDALVDAVRLYRDDGSGAFDPADTMVGEAGSMTLVAGEGVLDLADGLAALQHTPAETPAVYFLTLDMAPAASLAGVPTLRVTHTPGTPCVECDASLPAEGSAAENASFDVPLLQEVALHRTASFAVVADTFGGDGFADGFESGATLVWSATTP